MAYNTIHPIKKTLQLALDYICDPEKTDDLLYISSQNCIPETAFLEFSLTRDEAIRPGKNLAWHWIQSFAPGETDPSTAHEIGMKLASQHLGPDTEFIVSTHIDKGHIHNHILFNAVDTQTHKYYDADKKTYYQLRNRSDNICREYGLSVIEPRQQKTGKTVQQVYSEKSGKPTWTEQLKNTIDIVIPRCKSFDDFITEMQKAGYLLTRENSLSFCNKDAGQKRAIRINSDKFYGGAYKKDKIIQKINQGDPAQTKGKKRIVTSSMTWPGRLPLSFPNHYKIEAVQQARRKKDARQELQKVVATYNYLVDNNVKGLKDIENALSKTYEDLYSIRGGLKKLDNRIADTRQLKDISIRFHQVYSIVKAADQERDRVDYQIKHKKEFAVYASLRKQLKDRGFEKVPDVEKINRLLQDAESERADVYKKYETAKVNTDNVKMVFDQIAKMTVKDHQLSKANNTNVKDQESLL